MDLQELRNEIDITDKEILSLFMKRMELCKGVADYKKQNNMPVFQGGREKQVIDRIKSLTNDTSLENGTAALFTTIMDISKLLQNRKLLSANHEYNFSVPDFEKAEKIGCQGTSGANSETASRMIFGDKKPVFYNSFEDVFRAVQSGEIDYGVIPLKNSTAGMIDSAYDLMAKYSVYIAKQVCVEISHCLVAKKGTAIKDIECVYSHPQALAQCSAFLTENNLATSPYSNTATSAEMVSNSDEKIASICSADCAERLGLEILAENIADCSVNRTQFVCIARDLQVSPEADTISVMIQIPHTEGSLYRLLTKFYVNGMNLIRIENRPVRDGSFDVMFYLDFSGKLTDPAVRALMNDLSENMEYFRCLGTFRNE
ncbi:MAG: chorismate mutase [Ruminococcus flavefaciens]|nr:chorismate mutase [Ruminococcus flavefaciens]